MNPDLITAHVNMARAYWHSLLRLKAEYEDKSAGRYWGMERDLAALETDMDCMRLATSEEMQKARDAKAAWRAARIERTAA